MIDLAAIFGPSAANLVDIEVCVGQGTIYQLREAATERGVQFRHVRTNCISPWDMMGMKYLDNGEIKTAPFNPLIDLQLDGRSALIVLDDSGMDIAADIVTETYSAITSDLVTVVRLKYVG